MEIIIGIDPGDVTGLCIFQDGKFHGGHEFKDIHSLAKLIRVVNPQSVIAEQFTILGAKARGDRALKMLGGVELLQDEMGFKLVYQSPSILGVWLPKTKGLDRSPHIRSASAHVMCYLRREERKSQT